MKRILFVDDNLKKLGSLHRVLRPLRREFDIHFVEKRKKALWEILDNHYKELPNKSEETGSDKTWRLYLARMDSRKMNPTTEKTEDGFQIQWNPEI